MTRWVIPVVFSSSTELARAWVVAVAETLRKLNDLRARIVEGNARVSRGELSKLENSIAASRDSILEGQRMIANARQLIASSIEELRKEGIIVRVQKKVA